MTHNHRIAGLKVCGTQPDPGCSSSLKTHSLALARIEIQCHCQQANPLPLEASGESINGALHIENAAVLVRRRKQHVVIARKSGNEPYEKAFRRYTREPHHRSALTDLRP